LIAADDIDAVVIASSGDTHASLSLPASKRVSLSCARSP
jgi:predicted dehydrogenase